MTIARKLLAAILSVALVWLSMAGGIVAASTTGAQQVGHWRYHAQFVSKQEAGSHAHHAAGHLATTENPSEWGYEGSSERDCAAECLNTIAAKLLPSSVVVKTPDTDCVMVAFCVADMAVALPFPVARAYYWPAAPPDTAAVAGTGAARVLAHHSHLRL